MNHAVFLRLLSGKPLFTKTFGQFSTHKVKTNSPQKNPKQNKPQSNEQKPTNPSKQRFDTWNNDMWCTCLKSKEPQAYFLLFKEKEKLSRREIKGAEILLCPFHAPVFHSNVKHNTELPVLLVAVFAQWVCGRTRNILHN